MSHYSADKPGHPLALRLALGIGTLGVSLGLGCGGGSGSSGPGTPAPVINTFTATTKALGKGQSTLLSFQFANGTGTVDNGVGQVTSGQTLPVCPNGSCTYTLTVTNSAGQAATATVPITVKTFVSKFVYAANTGGGVSGFTLDDGTGALVEMADSPFDNGTPSMHVVSDPLGRFLISVNNDGDFTTDGLTVTAYPIDPTSGELQVATASAVPAPVGPWCAAVDPAGQYVYVRCENTIAAYSLDATTGALTHLADTATSAGHGDLVIHPDGKYLFAAANASDSLDVFGINPATGALTRIGSPLKMPAGTGPIGVAISNMGLNLFAKGEAVSATPSNAIYGYTIDLGTGALAPLGAVVSNLASADSYHGLTFSPVLSVLYAAYSSSDQNFGAYGFNAATGVMTSIADYAWMPDAGTDNIAVSASGKWFFATNYDGGEITLGAVNATTGALTQVGAAPVGFGPVSVTVVGSLN